MRSQSKQSPLVYLYYISPLVYFIKSTYFLKIVFVNCFFFKCYASKSSDLYKMKRSIISQGLFFGIIWSLFMYHMVIFNITNKYLAIGSLLNKFILFLIYHHKFYSTCFSFLGGNFQSLLHYSFWEFYNCRITCNIKK